MCSGLICPMILAHPNAIQQWRTLMGPTKSHVARATHSHTIRGLFGLSDTRNSTHGSGTVYMIIDVHMFLNTLSLLYNTLFLHTLTHTHCDLRLGRKCKERNFHLLSRV